MLRAPEDTEAARDLLRHGLDSAHELDSLEVRVLHLRLGLDDHNPRTRDETARLIGRSEANVRQIETRALTALGLDGLATFMPGTRRYHSRTDGTPRDNVVRLNSVLWWRTPDGRWTDGTSIMPWQEAHAGRHVSKFSVGKHGEGGPVLLDAALVKRDPKMIAYLAGRIELQYRLTGMNDEDARRYALADLDQLLDGRIPSPAALDLLAEAVGLPVGEIGRVLGLALATPGDSEQNWEFRAESIRSHSRIVIPVDHLVSPALVTTAIARHLAYLHGTNHDTTSLENACQNMTRSDVVALCRSTLLSLGEVGDNWREDWIATDDQDLRHALWAMAMGVVNHLWPDIAEFTVEPRPRRTSTSREDAHVG